MFKRIEDAFGVSPSELIDFNYIYSSSLPIIDFSDIIDSWKLESIFF